MIGAIIRTVSDNIESIDLCFSDISFIVLNINVLTSNIQNEPPTVPVYSYHCIFFMEVAKLFPNTSHGHEICHVKYKCSHATQAKQKNRYGK
jgi:hypothetical protein